MGKKNLSIFKISNLILLVILISLLPHSASAETKTFVKEYTYHAGDEDSKNSSRTIALREVKMLLMEELGTYLESQTEVKNFQMTKNQITTLTAGIVSAEVIEDKWDGKVYWLKAKIAANPQDVIKSIDSLRKDREKVKELEELRKRSEELLKENERLNKELKIAKDETKQETAQAYKQNINSLSATEWVERGYELAISGNYTDAVKAFSKAIELNPQDAAAYCNRGVAYVSLDNYQQAIEDCSKAIELNPQIAETYYIRGLVYVGLGNNQQAIKDFQQGYRTESSVCSALP
jgi:tetratricopeptide (TPR) repeat protein